MEEVSPVVSMPNWIQRHRQSRPGRSKPGRPYSVRPHQLFRILASLFVCLFIVLAGRSPARAAELVMFESDSCEWCETWDKEIAPVYPKTAEARIAPLRRVDIDDARPADLMQLRAVIYTPTFVLLHRGKEIGRIQGYPGEDFFWALLEELIAKLPRTETREKLSSNGSAGQYVACRGAAKPGTKQERRVSC